MTDPVTAPVRPRLRGVIHHYSAYVAAVAGIAAVVGAAILRDVGSTVACAVYALTIVGLFGVSATYHRITWQSARTRLLMKRADHSMIFLFIAGTYTPFCAMALSGATRWWVLGLVWVGALSGVALKVAWPGAPRWLGVALYILLGWVIVVVAPTLTAQTGLTVMVLLALGGVFYSVGGILYALRWPDPWPTTFGHHEVFHVCTAIAAVLHYIAVWLVIAA
nr:hemolysin III family protein [Gordonia soli]